MKLFNKKGTAGLNQVTMIVISIMVIAIIAVFTVIALNGMGDTISDTDADDIINESTVAISGVADWFDLFITFGVIVGLMVLLALVILVIRRAGLFGQGGDL